MTREQKNYLYADIIIDRFLVKEFLMYKWKHPKIKSAFKLASLFLKKNKIETIDIRQNYSYHRSTCYEVLEQADKWLENMVKIAKFNWLDD